MRKMPSSFGPQISTEWTQHCSCRSLTVVDRSDDDRRQALPSPRLKLRHSICGLGCIDHTPGPPRLHQVSTKDAATCSATASSDHALLKNRSVSARVVIGRTRRRTWSLARGKRSAAFACAETPHRGDAAWHTSGSDPCPTFLNSTAGISDQPSRGRRVPGMPRDEVREGIGRLRPTEG